MCHDENPWDAKPNLWRLPVPRTRILALYFFHLCDGRDVLIDPDGREVDDPASIGEMALREARAMISQDALGGRIMLNQYIEVRDQDAKLVHKMEFRDAVTLS